MVSSIRLMASADGGPITAKEAAAQLLLAVLIWKEEVITPTTPPHIAMDKMLGHVVDFLQKDTPKSSA